MWQPYLDQEDTEQQWVSQGRDRFGKEIWLHCLNEVEFLLNRVVMRTLGLHQAIVDILARDIYGRPGRSFRGKGRAHDWQIDCTPQIDKGTRDVQRSALR